MFDNEVSTLASFCPDQQFDGWDQFGIDTYETGTVAAPGERAPGERIPVLAAYLRSRGFKLPLGVGEYNGFSAETIAAAGEALLTTPNVWFGCMWHAAVESAHELSGDRLEAFRATVADPRAGSPRTG